MLNRTNVLIVFIALIGAALGLLAGQWFDRTHQRTQTTSLPTGMHVLRLGDQRADLTLADMNGRSHRLNEWDGKLLLLNFWATWCSPCREEMPLLEQMHARFADQNLEIVGIAIDNEDAVRKFLHTNPVQYPILLAATAQPDPSLLFGDTRNVLPYSVLIGPDSQLIAQHIGNFSEATLIAWLEPHFRK